MNGYTKIDIPGKGEVGLHFAYVSFKLIMGEKNKSLMFDEEGNPNELGVAKIIYSGYQNNCINKGIEAVLTFDDFTKAIDTIAVQDGGIQVLTDVIKCWSESTEVKSLVEKNAEKKSEVTPEAETPILTP